MDDLVTLQAGDLALDLWPELGGSMVELRHAGVSITQALAPGWREARNPSKLAGFACGPWFNRIPDGRFRFEGAEHVVPVDRPDLKAATHGFIRHRAPATIGLASDRVTFTDDYADPRSPYRYRSQLGYHLDAQGLTATLTLVNTGRRMPFALGFHPFFRRTPGLVLHVAADGFLANDESVLPARWAPIAERPSLLTGARTADLVGLNNSVTGWRQPARLVWSDLGLAASLTAVSSQPMLLHLFAPPDRDILCLEPVTNAADVLHRRAFAAYADMTPLDAGEQVSMTMRIEIARL